MSIDKRKLVGLSQAQREYVEFVEYNTKGLQAITTGPCAGCEMCRDKLGLSLACECGAPEVEGLYCDVCRDSGLRKPTEEEFGEQISTGEVCCEPFFSWDGCDICGSSLGGEFEPWHGVDFDGEIFHGNCACVDCVQYLANGTLPEASE